MRVEDPHLRRAIELARPNAKLPSRKQLADDNKDGLLQECYESVKDDVKKYLSGHSQFICITSDAWSSVLNEPIVNYMAVSPAQSLFLEAVHTEEQSHDVEWIAGDLVRVMDQGRRKIDNWGGGNIHIFVFCTISFFWNRNLDFKINCFYSLWTRIYEYCPPPQLSIFRRPCYGQSRW